MQKTRTWRELLGELISNPQERQRIADELNVTPITLSRWVQYESKPRIASLRRMLLVMSEHRQLLLELIEKEFPGFTLSQRDDGQLDEQLSIPSAFYKRVLHTLTALPHALRFESLCDLILQQMLEQLDPHKQGMAVIVACCMPPVVGNVHSLREKAGRGTPPWNYDLEQQGRLLGAESLAGHVLGIAHLDVNQSLTEPSGREAGYAAQWEESAVAVPIMQLGKAAGSLLVSSTRPDYFSPARCALIESYAELIMLAFDQEDFYEFEQIELVPLPPREAQQPYFAGFAFRVAQVMVQSAGDEHPMNVLQAQRMVWQQIEQELLPWYLNEQGQC